MADFKENQDGVFGGIQFNQNGNGNETENTSYFENTIESGTESTTTTNGVSSGVYGSFTTTETNNETVNDSTNFQPIQKDKAITKQGLWSKIKAFLFQEIDLNAPVKIKLTPYQQKVEDEINDFLHQDITFKGISSIFKGKN